MARRCGNCIHKNVCELYEIVQDPTHAVACGNFLDTADVVPKSEVAKIFEEIESEIKLALESNYKAKREHIDKNYYCLHAEFLSAVQGKIDALRGIDDFIAELKKKYTESEKDNGD